MRSAKAREFKNLLREMRNAEFRDLLEKIFGGDAEAAAEEFAENEAELFLTVMEGASPKAEESLEKQIAEREKKSKNKTVVAPDVKTTPAKKPITKTKSKKLSFNNQPKLDWRQFVFGFQPLPGQQKTGSSCTNCGNDVGKARFCPECGTSAKQAKRACSDCGFEPENPTKFCPECGSKVNV